MSKLRLFLRDPKIKWYANTGENDIKWEDILGLQDCLLRQRSSLIYIYNLNQMLFMEFILDPDSNLKS